MKQENDDNDTKNKIKLMFKSYVSVFSVSHAKKSRAVVRKKSKRTQT